MSKAIGATARAPTRRHGVARVEAILAAATRLFAERGLDGTTMSAIAAESGTAPGSLYRFFSSRDAIWDALLGRYVALWFEQLAVLKAQAPMMSTRDLVRHMIEDMRGRLALRQVAIAFLDTREDSVGRRAELRREVVFRTGEVLAAHAPETDRAALPVITLLILQMLRSVGALEKAKEQEHWDALPELEKALTLYLDSVLKGAQSTAP